MLRIFFEREVKTKHTPTLFGSTFKGSKWADYQTFNINKLFIKSGLSYFYYIIIIVMLTFIFLGRSKSEQYFGFLPIFTYINFLLGYVPIICSDVTSQLVIIIYMGYNFLYKLFSTKLNTFFSNNILLNDSIGYKLNTKPDNNQYIVNLPHWFSTDFFHKDKHSGLSKILSQARKDLVYTGNSKFVYNDYNNQLFSSFTLYAARNTDIISSTIQPITISESVYTGVVSTINYKVINTSTTLNNINKSYQAHHSPSKFNFNLKTNLDVSNQQRWLTKNSLLTESLVHNSFLLTQVKKLIGTGVLNKDFSSQSLWLPTKSSQLSSAESYVYFNNLLNNNTLRGGNFSKNYQTNNPHFSNLNFFENSRL